jgi:hypothetical protein
LAKLPKLLCSRVSAKVGPLLAAVRWGSPHACGVIVHDAALLSDDDGLCGRRVRRIGCTARGHARCGRCCPRLCGSSAYPAGSVLLVFLPLLL